MYFVIKERKLKKKKKNSTFLIFLNSFFLGIEKAKITF